MDRVHINPYHQTIMTCLILLDTPQLFYQSQERILSRNGRSFWYVMEHKVSERGDGEGGDGKLKQRLGWFNGRRGIGCPHVERVVLLMNL